MTPEAVAAAYDAQVEARGLGRRPWRGLQRSDVYRQIVWAVVQRRWDERDGELSNAAPEKLRELVGEGWDDIAALCGAGVELSAAALRELASQGVRTTPGVLSERVVVRVAGVHRERGVVPDAAELAMLAADVAESYLKGSVPSLDREEFAEAVGNYYDACWEERGAATLAAFSPSLVALGRDVRPPLVAKREPGSWHLGLDRSVWGRYRLHTKPTAKSRTSPPGDPACATHDEHERRRDPAAIPPVALAREETDRVCSPYGLAEERHQGVVLALGHGLDLAETTAETAGRARTGVWRDWAASKCEPLGGRMGATPARSEPDAGLVRAVGDFTGLWRATPVAYLLEAAHGPLDWRVEVIHRAVARKTWMDLHRREREFAEPMRRAHIVRAIRTAFDKGVPEALLRERESALLREWDGDLPEQVETGPEVPVDRRYRTCDLLLDHVDELESWRAQALETELGWFARYDEIVAGAPESAEHYLTAAEVARMLVDEWSDPDE